METNQPIDELMSEREIISDVEEGEGEGEDDDGIPFTNAKLR